MKKTLILFFAFLFPFSLISQPGRVYETRTLQSKILNMDRKYAIYLPPGYESTDRSYPVLYLLHGATDNHTGWVQFGEVQHIADKEISEGTATPMIIVMPDADTGQMGYFNDVTGEWRYEDFFFEEFIPFIEKNYRIRAEKRYRAIAGLSMGGGGTFMYALHHPDMFSSACPLSAATGPVRLDDADDWFARHAKVSTVSKTKAESYLRKHSACLLIQDMPVDEVKKVRWYIDCGDDDFLYEGNSMVHILMRKKNIPHEFRIRDGNHGWKYWREALPVVLSFVSESFHK